MQFASFTIGLNYGERLPKAYVAKCFEKFGLNAVACKVNNNRFSVICHHQDYYARVTGHYTKEHEDNWRTICKSRIDKIIAINKFNERTETLRNYEKFTNLSREHRNSKFTCFEASFANSDFTMHHIFVSPTGKIHSKNREN
jgi:hypothetical protein